MKNETYEEFVAKFVDKPKTTDDCYTPRDVYEAVLRYFTSLYQLEDKRIRRPFYPGGDYKTEAESYGPDDIVIDNPPFSILQEIIDWYNGHGVKFILFSPGLMHNRGAMQICPGFGITYANKAKVNTSFSTNLEREGIRTDPALRKVLEAAQPTHPIKAKDYNRAVLTPARAGVYARKGIYVTEYGPVIRKYNGEPVYGGGVLLSQKNKYIIKTALDE